VRRRPVQEAIEDAELQTTKICISASATPRSPSPVLQTKTCSGTHKASSFA
jgi:hypothetical protein